MQVDFTRIITFFKFSFRFLRRFYTKMDEKIIMRELYDTLEKLRYPEVAQTSFHKFEEVILTGTKRTDLLYWLLQGPGFNIASFNKLKDNTLEDKLLTCYTQIGLCSDENVLLGKCPIDKQLKFLSLLTSFMKNINLAVNESLKNDKENINDSLNAVPLKSIDDDFQTKHTNENEDEKEISNNEIENSKCPESLEPEHSNKKSNLDELCLAVKANIKKMEEQKTDNFESTLTKFNTSFKKVEPSAAEEVKNDNFTELYKDLSIDIQNINSTFSIVDKILINETKIGNLEIPEDLNKIVKPLTKPIKKNLVLIESSNNYENVFD